MTHCLKDDDKRVMITDVFSVISRHGGMVTSQTGQQLPSHVIVTLVIVGPVSQLVGCFVGLLR